MSQQINLRSAQQTHIPSGVVALLGLGLYLVVLGLWALLRWSDGRDAQADLEALLAEESQLTAQVGARASSPTQKAVSAIDAEIAELNKRLDASRSLVQLLEEGSAEFGRGHSRGLRALSAASMEGVWLRSIELDAAGKTVALEGGATGHERVMRYSNRLNQSLGALGIEFQTLDISGGGYAPGTEARATTPQLSFRIK